MMGSHVECSTQVTEMLQECQCKVVMVFAKSSASLGWACGTKWFGIAPSDRWAFDPAFCKYQQLGRQQRGIKVWAGLVLDPSWLRAGESAVT